MTDEAGPRTEAGRRLLDRLARRMDALGGREAVGADWEDVRRALPAIEAEAAIPDSRLRAALDDFLERSPIDTDGETGDEWCHYCESFDVWSKSGVKHRDGCEWEALRAALSPEGRQEPERA